MNDRSFEDNLNEGADDSQPPQSKLTIIKFFWPSHFECKSMDFPQLTYRLLNRSSIVDKICFDAN